MLALLLAASTLFLGLKSADDRATEKARTQAVAASRDAARILFSYNNRTLDADFARGLAVTTGPFRTEYEKTTTQVVKPVAEQYSAVVQAEVIESAVVSASSDTVTTIVFLNQTTNSTRVEGPQVDQSRVRMRLVRRGGSWLVDKVDAL